MARKSASTEPNSIDLPASLIPFTGFLLNKAAQQAREMFEDSIAPLNIRAKHFGLLSLLNETGPISQQVAGARLRVDRTTMVFLLDEMERLKLVVRRRHPTDRRAHAVCLTSKGKQVRKKALKIARSVHERLTCPLSKHERATLNALLQALLAEKAN